MTHEEAISDALSAVISRAEYYRDCARNGVLYGLPKEHSEAYLRYAQGLSEAANIIQFRLMLVEQENQQ